MEALRKIYRNMCATSAQMWSKSRPLAILVCAADVFIVLMLIAWISLNMAPGAARIAAYAVVVAFADLEWSVMKYGYNESKNR